MGPGGGNLISPYAPLLAQHVQHLLTRSMLPPLAVAIETPPIHSTLPVKKKKAALSGCKTTTSNSLKVKYVEMLIDVGKPRACSCLPILSFRWRCKNIILNVQFFFFK